MSDINNETTITMTDWVQIGDTYHLIAMTMDITATNSAGVVTRVDGVECGANTRADGDCDGQ